jgi:hypothetical protein
LCLASKHWFQNIVLSSRKSFLPLPWYKFLIRTVLTYGSVCLAVSKAWKAFLERFHDIWTALDMRRCRGTISLNSIKSHCRRSNYTLNRVIVNNTHHGFNGGKLEYLLHTCKKLQHLEYYGRGYIRDSLIAAIHGTSNIRTIITGQHLVISPATVFSALKACPQIVRAEFHNIDSFRPNLQAEWCQMDALETLNLTSCKGNNTSLIALNLVSLYPVPLSLLLILPLRPKILYAERSYRVIFTPTLSCTSTS